MSLPDPSGQGGGDIPGKKIWGTKVNLYQKHNLFILKIINYNY